MSALKAQAIEMIADVPEDRMARLIAFISTLTPRQEDIARKRAAFERLEELRKEHAHLFPANFDPDKALEEARAERFERRYGAFIMK